MTKKILLSGAVLALLTTTAFAGDLSFTQPHTVLSTESYMQNGLDEINATTLVYTPNFNLNDRPSGLIPEASIQLDISDLEFPISVTNDELGTDYDALGKGIAATALTKDQLDVIFNGTAWEDNTPGDTHGDQFQFEHTIISGDTVVLNFGSDVNSFYKDHTYVLVDDTNTPDQLSFKFNALSGAKLKIKTFHPDITTEAIDDAEVEYNVTTVPQFSVACVRKFDGLINFENDRVSFVNPEHGERIGTNPLETPNDTLITSDRMIFTIDNARLDNATRWMGGHATQFSFTASNKDNDFTAWTASTVKIYHTQPTTDGVDTINFTATNPTATTSFGPILLTADTRDDVLASSNGTFVFDALTDTFTVTYPNEELKIGKTTFVVDLLKPTDTTPLRPVKFTNPFTDLEAGLNLADDTRSNIIQNGHPTGPNHFVLNDEDDSGVITPQNQTVPVSADAGEWMDHAYIAQIAGVGHNDSVLSRIFITNRSCADVKPTFKVIQNGVVQSVTNIGNYKNSTQSIEISVDSQNIYQLKDIIDAAVLADTTNKITASGVYAIEIVLPGVAEDFYVYAQSKNSDNTNTYDLPVYNTSARD